MKITGKVLATPATGMVRGEPVIRFVVLNGRRHEVTAFGPLAVRASKRVYRDDHVEVCGSYSERHGTITAKSIKNVMRG